MERDKYTGHETQKSTFNFSSYDLTPKSKILLLCRQLLKFKCMNLNYYTYVHVCPGTVISNALEYVKVNFSASTLLLAIYFYCQTQVGIISVLTALKITF